MYKCHNCGRVFKKLGRDAWQVKCPHCGFRILFKPRPEVVRRVRAI